MPTSKSDMEEEVNSGRFPPCLCYMILFSSSKERRVRPALLKVDLLGADKDLTFSCTFKEDPGKMGHICLCYVCMYITYIILYFMFVCRLYTLSSLVLHIQTTIIQHPLPSQKIV